MANRVSTADHAETLQGINRVNKTALNVSHACVRENMCHDRTIVNRFFIHWFSLHTFRYPCGVSRVEARNLIGFCWAQVQERLMS